MLHQCMDLYGYRGSTKKSLPSKVWVAGRLGALGPDHQDYESTMAVGIVGQSSMRFEI